MSFKRQLSKQWRGWQWYGIKIAAFTGSTTIADSIVAQNAGGTILTVTGDPSVTGVISGDGSSITSLNGSNISSGTVNDARLSANVTVQGNTFNGNNQLVQTNGSGQLPAISGALLTTLNASSNFGRHCCRRTIEQ